MDFTRSRRAAFSGLATELSPTLAAPWTAAAPDFTQILATDANGDQHLRYKFATPVLRRFFRLRLVE